MRNSIEHKVQQCAEIIEYATKLAREATRRSESLKGTQAYGDAELSTSEQWEAVTMITQKVIEYIRGEHNGDVYDYIRRNPPIGQHSADVYLRRGLSSLNSRGNGGWSPRELSRTISVSGFDSKTSPKTRGLVSQIVRQSMAPDSPVGKKMAEFMERVVEANQFFDDCQYLRRGRAYKVPKAGLVQAAHDVMKQIKQFSFGCAATVASTTGVNQDFITVKTFLRMYHRLCKQQGLDPWSIAVWSEFSLVIDGTHLAGPKSRRPLAQCFGREDCSGGMDRVKAVLDAAIKYGDSTFVSSGDRVIFGLGEDTPSIFATSALHYIATSGELKDSLGIPVDRLPSHVLKAMEEADEVEFSPERQVYLENEDHLTGFHVVAHYGDELEARANMDIVEVYIRIPRGLPMPVRTGPHFVVKDYYDALGGDAFFDSLADTFVGEALDTKRRCIGRYHSSRDIVREIKDDTPGVRVGFELELVVRPGRKRTAQARRLLHSFTEASGKNVRAMNIESDSSIGHRGVEFVSGWTSVKRMNTILRTVAEREARVSERSRVWDRWGVSCDTGLHVNVSKLTPGGESTRDSSRAAIQAIAMRTIAKASMVETSFWRQDTGTCQPDINTLMGARGTLFELLLGRSPTRYCFLTPYPRTGTKYTGVNINYPERFEVRSPAASNDPTKVMSRIQLSVAIMMASVSMFEIIGNDWDRREWVSVKRLRKFLSELNEGDHGAEYEGQFTEAAAAMDEAIASAGYEPWMLEVEDMVSSAAHVWSAEQVADRIRDFKEGQMLEELGVEEAA